MLSGWCWSIGGSTVGVGGDLFDSGEVRVFVGDFAQVGSAG